MGDEYQSLLTASKTDFFSDLQAWGVLRSALVAGITLSQSWSSYRVSVGNDALQSIRDSWRSRIYLRTESQEVLDEITKLLGKTQRFQTTQWDHFEGVIAAKRETGIDGEAAIVKWNYGPSSVASFGDSSDKFHFTNYKELFEHDTRFHLSTRGSLVQKEVNIDAVVGAQQASAWRQEDRQTGLLQHGSSMEDVFGPSDLMGMGRGRAVAITLRATSTIAEVIHLNHSFDDSPDAINQDFLNQIEEAR